MLAADEPGQANGGSNARSSSKRDSLSLLNLTSEGKRQARINELIATEEDYVRDLEIVAVIFRDQLFSTKAITASDKEAIFSNWDQLIEKNHKFIKMLHKKKRESLQTGMAIERIGSTLSQALDMMEKAYIYYCNRLLSAEKMIEKKSEDSGYFADQVKRFSRDPRCSGLNLAAYLLIPFQRVTRYPLLIKKIAEYTGEEHVDHEDTRNALNVAETLCSRVNEGRRLYENRERLEWMQSHILLSEDVDIRFNSETRLTIHRELVHMGSLTKVNSGKELMAFLCNDLLILTIPTRDVGKVSNLFASEKAMSSMYKLYKHPLHLDEIELVTTSPCPTAAATTAAAERSFPLQHSSSNSSSSSPSSLADQHEPHSVFDLWIGRKTASDSRKLISFRAIHANDKLYWMQKLTKSIRFYHENMHRITKQDLRRSSISSHAARLLLTVTEVLNRSFRHATVAYFFVASVGSTGDPQADHRQIESSAAVTVTRDPHRASLAFESLDSNNGRLMFDHAMRFFLSEEDVQGSSVVVSLYERTPFSPDRLLGAGHLSVSHVRQTLLSTTGRPLLLSLLLTTQQQRHTISGSNGHHTQSAGQLQVLVKVDLL